MPISSDREADQMTNLRGQMAQGDASGLRVSLTLAKTPLSLRWPEGVSATKRV